VTSWPEVHEFINSIPSTTCGGTQPQFLYELSAATQGGGAVVEIGTFVGRSTIALAFGQKEKGGERVHTFDLVRHPKIDDNLREAGVDDFVELNVKQSTAAAKDWDRPIELLWIDGDHSSAAVRGDIKAWSRHVVEGGRVAFHDYPGLDPTKTVHKPIAQLMFGDPVHWRTVSDREHGSIVVFERLAPAPEIDGRPSLRQRLLWLSRGALAWLAQHFPRAYWTIRRRRHWDQDGA
jgi:hypothetical protein